MNNEELRAEIKTELNRHTYSSKLRAELLNRCYVALGDLDLSMLPSEAQTGLTLQRNEIDRLKQQLRDEGDRIAELRACLEFIYPFVKGKTVSNRRAAQGTIYTINIGAEIDKALGGAA